MVRSLENSSRTKKKKKKLTCYPVFAGVSGSSNSPSPPSNPGDAYNLNAPTPTQPGANCGCKRWHMVSSGNSCDSISRQYGISAGDFQRSNPNVGSTCTTLWLGYNVCVGV